MISTSLNGVDLETKHSLKNTLDVLHATEITKFEDSFAEENWTNTYKDHKDNKVNDSFKRIAVAIASVEDTEEKREEWAVKFFNLLTNFKGVPGGRTFSNAGTDWSGTTLMNCFVGPRGKYDIDSIEGIYNHLLQQSQTLKSEGGWGENFSYIRPRGSFIAGIGIESPGSVKYMELFDKASEIITSGSGKKINNKQGKNKVRKGAMMGVLDCIAGDTLIDTIDGRVKIKDLVGQNPYLFCTDGNGNLYVRQAIKVWSKGIKKTVKVIFDTGDFVECTPEHEFMTPTGEFISAKSLEFGQSIAALTVNLHGKYLSAGVTRSRKSNGLHNLVFEMKYGYYPTILGQKKRTGNLTIAHHIDSNPQNNHPDNIIEMTISEHSRHHDENFKANRKNRKGKTWEELYGKEKADEIRRKYTAKRVGQKPWNAGIKGTEYKIHYENGFTNQFSNHKVLRIEESIEQEVFDISMPDYHNFSANGVFVHNCWHPDIIEFITAKQQPGRLTKFNISVNVSDEFMTRLNTIKQLDVQLDGYTGNPYDEHKQNLVDEFNRQDEWNLIFPDTTHPKYRKEWNGDINHWKGKGYPVKVYNTVSVKWLWNLIMESTYNRAEPGVLFLDRANHFNPFYYGETIFATNPCGEQTLSPGNICCLGSLNLTQFVDKNGFNLPVIKEYTQYMVRFLDNVNSYSSAPLPEYEDSMRKKRRIGLGVMGWGSALFMLNVRFGSERASELREQLMTVIARTAYETSIDLAEEKGMFAYCKPEKHAEGTFIQQLGLSPEYMEKLRTIGIRNASLMSQQPTGNTSIVANIVSGGIEPIFMPEYIRTVILARTPEEILARTPKWWEGAWHETDLFKFVKEGDEEILRGEHFGTVYKIDKNRGLTKEVLCEDYGVRYLKKRGQWDPNADWAVTTTNLTVDDHVTDLEGFARWTDSACSKTVNIPHDYPFDLFKNLYLDVYNTGFIKGFTSYRAGTMTSVLAAVDEKTATNEDEEIILDDVKLPDSSPATMKTLRAESKKWYLTVIWNDTMTRPFALFVQTNHHEKNVIASDAVDRLSGLAQRKGIPQQFIDEVHVKIAGNDNASKIARMISLCLRHGILIKNIVSELDKIDEAYVGSFLFTIKKFLSSFIKDGEKVEGVKCSECGGSNIIYQEGCSRCADCSHSKC
jgi:ribonucleoside-diphosphate reductase alpha chain